MEVVLTLLTFSNVVGNTSVQGFWELHEDTSNDTVVFQSTATDINVDFAEGADSLSFLRVQPTPPLLLQVVMTLLLLL